LPAGFIRIAVYLKVEIKQAGPFLPLKLKFIKEALHS
jgi:hypothetical protein